VSLTGDVAGPALTPGSMRFFELRRRIESISGT
jgi:hypothetical protein